MKYKKYLKKKVFGVNMIGWGTLALVMIAALVVGLVPNAIVVPVTKNSSWVMFYASDMDRWQLDSGVAEQDFENQGWTIITKVGVEDRAYAADGWTQFTTTYKSNPAICLIDTGQTPIYAPSERTDPKGVPYYWAGLIWDGNDIPGKISQTAYKGDTYIVGNARTWNADDYVLIKFLTYQGRSVIIVWTGIRFDTGQLTGYVLAWRWVCVYGAYHEKNWYILDQRGNIVDSEIITGDSEETTGDNPEDNPLLHPEEEGVDYTDPEEPLPDEPIYDPMRQTRAILLIVVLLAVLVAMGGFVIWFGKKIGLFV